MDIVVTRTGNCRHIYSEIINPRMLGEVCITRASHVEPNGDGHWLADLTPVNGPILGPFVNRTAALEAEVLWLRENWITRW